MLNFRRLCASRQSQEQAKDTFPGREQQLQVDVFDALQTTQPAKTPQPVSLLVLTHNSSATAIMLSPWEQMTGQNIGVQSRLDIGVIPDGYLTRQLPQR